MAERPLPERPWPVRRTFPVTYHDLDVLRHLNHAAYFPMMETLRCEYYLGLLGTQDPADLDIIVAEAACRYLAPVEYGRELVGEVAPARPLGRTSFVLLYRFRELSSGTVSALGRTVIVTYDYARAVKREIPPDRRRRLEADAIDPAAAGWEEGPVRSTRNGGEGDRSDPR
jgi:acyl-CoA thioesterase FadM